MTTRPPPSTSSPPTASSDSSAPPSTTASPSAPMPGARPSPCIPSRPARRHISLASPSSRDSPCIAPPEWCNRGLAPGAVPTGAAPSNACVATSPARHCPTNASRSMSAHRSSTDSNTPSTTTTHVVLDPLDFIARLAALVPRPRAHLTRYHGVFAPNFRLRNHIVPNTAHQGARNPHLPTPPMSWMQRLNRVFHFDVEHCPVCGGTLRVIACIEAPHLIERILAHLAPPPDADSVPRPRPPPSELAQRAEPPSAPGAELSASPSPVISSLRTLARNSSRCASPVSNIASHVPCHRCCVPPHTLARLRNAPP